MSMLGIDPASFSQEIQKMILKELRAEMVPRVVWGVVSGYTAGTPPLYTFTPEASSSALANQWPYLGADLPENGETVGGIWVGTDLFLTWRSQGNAAPVPEVPGANLPVGTSIDYRGSAAPTGFLLEDGSAVSRTTYANLYNVIGTTYGAGDGSTTFNLPDSRGRVSVGAGTGSGLTARALGATGGEENHTLVDSEMPVHSHSGTTDIENAQHDHIQGLGGSLSNVANVAGNYVIGNANTQATSVEQQNHGHTIPNDGGGAAHNNMQPFLVVTKIIKF